MNADLIVSLTIALLSHSTWYTVTVQIIPIVAERGRFTAPPSMRSRENSRPDVTKVGAPGKSALPAHAVMQEDR